LGYIGFLHTVLKEAVMKIEILEAKII